GVVIDLLPRVLEALQDSHPGIDVEVAILGSSQALERLALGTLDIGLVALPQPPLRGTVVTPWRDQTVKAFVPASWPSPRTVAPGWLAQQPLIFNDATTHMHRLTMAWFADGGCAPRARIELNYDAAIRSLVAAGYGAALLPVYESRDAETDARLKVLPLKPRLVRRLGIAHRDEASLDGSTERVIETLVRFRQG
ncbi:MAG TPA: LysR family transcriptional regulator substrate-binding protein, partial [Variovorax sp.]|nr:LysR family transcriptional regulator substrate-binding protein [Variovorax sp.]